MVNLGLGQGRVEEMCHRVVLAEIAHGVNLVFHQGDERGNHDGGTLHEERGQLVAERFSATCGHKDKNVVTVEEAADYRFLVAFEGSEAEMSPQGVDEGCPVVHNLALEDE